MPLPSLLPCPGCARHLRSSEQTCPFCQREVASLFRHPQLHWFPAERFAPALLAFATAGSVVVACHGSHRPGTAPTSNSASPLTAAVASAPPSASALALPSAPALPSASASSAQAPRPDGSPDEARARGPIAVYGAPSPPVEPTMPRGEVSLER